MAFVTFHLKYSNAVDNDALWNGGISYDTTLPLLPSMVTVTCGERSMCFASSGKINILMSASDALLPSGSDSVKSLFSR